MGEDLRIGLGGAPDAGRRAAVVVSGSVTAVPKTITRRSLGGAEPLAELVELALQLELTRGGDVGPRRSRPGTGSPPAPDPASALAPEAAGSSSRRQRTPFQSIFSIGSVIPCSRR